MSSFDPNDMRSMMDYFSSEVEEPSTDVDSVLLKFIENCIFMGSQSHHWHLQSEEYSLHMILDELYEDLPEVVDSLVEGLMSDRGAIFSTGMSYVFQPVQNALQVLEDLVQQGKFIHQVLEDAEEFSSVSDLDNVMAVIKRAIYKLKVL